jgi:hypothetical protein
LDESIAAESLNLLKRESTAKLTDDPNHRQIAVAVNIGQGGLVDLGNTVLCTDDATDDRESDTRKTRSVLRVEAVTNRISVVDRLEFDANPKIVKFDDRDTVKVMVYSYLTDGDDAEQDQLYSGDFKVLASLELLRFLLERQTTGVHLHCFKAIGLDDSDNELNATSFKDLYESLRTDIPGLKLLQMVETDASLVGNLKAIRKIEKCLSARTLLMKSWTSSVGPLNIYMVTPEYRGVASVGGIGMMVSDLAEQLAIIGENVTVIMPLYTSSKGLDTKYVREIEVKVANEMVPVEIFSTVIRGVSVILFQSPEVFDSVYCTRVAVAY